MRKTSRAALGSLVFLVLVPGLVAGLLPWALTGWESRSSSPPLQVAGWVLVVAGTGVLLHAFARFVVEGVGTPAPVAPTERLVVGGLYRHVRNPMYLAVAATIVGQALILGRPGLLVYAAIFAAVVAAFVHGYEGADAHRALRRAVRGLPARGAGLVAAPAALGRALKTRSQRPSTLHDVARAHRSARAVISPITPLFASE